ncbi:MAG TPA: CDGSH iron-sulfur domain-containing protein [Elusimicrobiota bacterium]|nr:CDGSH iron-sulfur domain-containing protein [Elusimicrobiota bacterium]
MADVKIQALKNGPLLVQGSAEILGSDGQPMPAAKQPVALCRCGHSNNKPFCDGMHGKAGFQSVCVRQTTR